MDWVLDLDLGRLEVALASWFGTTLGRNGGGPVFAEIYKFENCILYRPR